MFRIRASQVHTNVIKDRLANPVLIPGKPMVSGMGKAGKTLRGLD